MKEIHWIGIIAALVILVVFAFMGPAGCSRHLQSWHARAYGSDWLVIQYNLSGEVIAKWELIGKSIGSENNSDGIFFTDNDGNVVHLSGHYIYVQIENNQWETANKKLLSSIK